MEIRCVQGDINKYTIVPVEIIFKGKKQRIMGAVTHPLILGMSHTFKFMGQCVGVQLRCVGLCGMYFALSGDTRSSRDAEEAQELTPDLRDDLFQTLLIIQTHLTQKGVPALVQWTSGARWRFRGRPVLCGELLLHMPNFSLPFVL